MVPYRLANQALISVPGEHDNWHTVSSWASGKLTSYCRVHKCDEYTEPNTTTCITHTMDALSTDSRHVEYLVSSPTWRPMYFRLRTNLLKVGHELNPQFLKDIYQWRIAKLPLITELSRISTFSLVHTDGSPYYPGYAAYQAVQGMLKFLYLSSVRDRLFSISHMWNSSQYWKLAYDKGQLYYQQGNIVGAKVASSIGGAPHNRMWAVK